MKALGEERFLRWFQGSQKTDLKKNMLTSIFQVKGHIIFLLTLDGQLIPMDKFNLR